MNDALKSVLIIAPSLLLWGYLIGNEVMLPYPYLIVYAILFWTALDFVIVVYLDPHRRTLAAATIPAFLGVIAVVLFYVIAESLNRYFEHLGFNYLTPFVAAAVLLIYVAIFMEKNPTLKVYLSLSSMVLAALWVLGQTDKVTLPF